MLSIYTPKPENLYICVVCSRTAVCYHFGAKSCNACAAFFRRTVANKKKYACTDSGKCVINFLLNTACCPACRLQKCYSVGMQESGVNAFGSTSKRIIRKKYIKPQQKSSFSLQKFDHSSLFSSFPNNKVMQNLLFVNRSILHQRMMILRPAVFPLYKKSSIADMNDYILHESRFCQLFRSSTGIIDVAQEVIEQKIPNVILYWGFITTVLNTLQYDNIGQRKLTLVDHSMLKMSEASIREMYAMEPLFIKHFDTLVNTALPVWYRTEELINQIRKLGMTNEEQAVFLILGMIESITLLSSNPQNTRLRVKPLRNTIFRAMKTYYSENFSNDCTAEIYNIFYEHRIIISLCNGITENYTPANLLKAFQSQNNVKTNADNKKLFIQQTI